MGTSEWNADEIASAWQVVDRLGMIGPIDGTAAIQQPGSGQSMLAVHLDCPVSTCTGGVVYQLGSSTIRCIVDRPESHEDRLHPKAVQHVYSLRCSAHSCR